MENENGLSFCSDFPKISKFEHVHTTGDLLKIFIAVKPLEIYTCDIAPQLRKHPKIAAKFASVNGPLISFTDINDGKTLHNENFKR